jgi:hypothetical protein
VKGKKTGQKKFFRVERWGGVTSADNQKLILINQKLTLIVCCHCSRNPQSALKESKSI